MPQTIAKAVSVKSQVRRMFWLWLCAMFAIGLVGLFASVASGQAAAKFEVMKYRPDFFTDKGIMTKIKNIKNDIKSDPNALNDAEKVRFFKLIYTNIFASMTDPKEKANIHTRKAEVMKDIYDASRKGNTRVAIGLSTMCVNECTKIAKGNYYLGARINAVFLIGEMNEREMKSLEKLPPVPMSRALPVLLELSLKPEYNDGIKVAALTGVRRHAQLASDRWKPADQDRICDQMIAIVESAPPEGRDPEAHGWIQSMAIDILLAINNPRRADTVASLVMNVASDKDSSARVLVRAVAATPEIKPPKAFGKTDELLKRWATHLGDQVQAHANRIDAIENPIPIPEEPAKGRNSEYGDEYGPTIGGPMLAGQTEPPTPEILLARRALNDVLETFRLGLTGVRTGPGTKGLIAAIDDAAKKAEAQKLVSLIGEVTTGVNDKRISKNIPYIKQLRKMELKMRVFVDPKAAGPEDDKPKDDARGFVPGFRPGAPFGAPAAPGAGAKPGAAPAPAPGA